jgi:delta-aminolevulinic acid dehydratase/porphobilinogen synthase
LIERTVVGEILGAVKRAGADMIFTYHTPSMLEWLAETVTRSGR